MRRFRRCGKSRRTSAAVHSGAPEARDERKRYYGRRTTTIADDMPDTKRTRTRFLNYVNAFNNGLLRDQTAITSPPPGFHWSLVENAARRVPFENRSDGGLAAVVTDPPAFSRNRFSSSRNRFYETKRRSLASSHDWLICLAQDRIGWEKLLFYYSSMLEIRRWIFYFSIFNKFYECYKCLGGIRIFSITQFSWVTSLSKNISAIIFCERGLTVETSKSKADKLNKTRVSRIISAVVGNTYNPCYKSSSISDDGKLKDITPLLRVEKFTPIMLYR